MRLKVQGVEGLYEIRSSLSRALFESLRFDGERVDGSNGSKEGRVRRGWANVSRVSGGGE